MQKSRLIFSRYSPSRLERRRKQLVLASGAGLCALLMGATLVGTKYSSHIHQWSMGLPFQEQSPVLQGKQVNTPVLQLVSLPSKKRAAQLEAIAFGPQSLDRVRARYLLAADLIEQKQGKQALRWLEGLEWDYPVLAAQIAVKRAQAYELIPDQAKARLAWEDVLKRYSDEPVAAEALYALWSANPQYWEKAKQEYHSNPLLEIARHWYAFSPDDPQYWERALKKFPSHPRILAIARQQLQQNPNQPQLMVLLARYTFDSPDISSVLDRLVSQYGHSQSKKARTLIQPKDWEAIALGYWNERKYSQASAAYAKAEHTPRNAYLSALALQYAHKSQSAKRAYKELVRDFPNAEETASALIQLATLEPSEDIIPALDQVIQQFPERAGEALLARAEILDGIGIAQAANQARELLLTQHGNSDAAADYRWRMAKTKAKAGDLGAALQWAGPIMVSNPNSEPARQAGFWVGKWASKLGLRQQAKVAFEQVIAKYPQSYYAWRSAVQLGWNVGDFTTVRQLDPQVVLPTMRPELPVGSPALKELYQLGQDQDAWTLWQAEFQNRLQPTVAEQFTDGIMRVGVGDYLEGIAKISKLEDRDTPEEQAEYQQIKQQVAYWHTLYPFPFVEVIEEQAQQRDLNPLLVTALIRQESRFKSDIRSKAGAVGLMQMMPSTGAWAAKEINLKKYALENPNDNIKLGTWFLDQTHRVFKNNSLLAVASYNAGQGNLSRWLQNQRPIDPDEFVETIPFDETQDYVKQVFGNYWNYLRLYDPQVAQQVAQHTANPSIAMRR
ncbi:transglycosylase SLT domain-containing protein [Allocoleopsis sp.]|uniref:lytic transglycosylase domain-containing protein n=1 Tax=Allocoleopsis sp. TaxID=3088169 RepID=UPI002FD426DE